MASEPAQSDLNCCRALGLEPPNGVFRPPEGENRGRRPRRQIKLINTGEALLAPTITRRLIERFAKPIVPSGALASLTPRETDVLKDLSLGLSNAEVAADLRLSEATVKTHVARLLAKLGVRDRVQAVIASHRKPGTHLKSPWFRREYRGWISEPAASRSWPVRRQAPRTEGWPATYCCRGMAVSSPPSLAPC
jgi:DNA-binding CsgD family transcriptional regulator